MNTTLSRRAGQALALLAAIGFCVANSVNALRKGGDFQAFLVAGRRMLAGAPLYTGSSVGDGVTWPPFLGLFFVPFAALDASSAVAARLAWYLFGLVCLAGGVRFWARTCSHGRAERLEISSAAVFLPLLCVFFPLQTNFEHQNLNPLLLLLLGAATFAIARRRAALGGVLVGTATALKAFPALLIVYLVHRRIWAAAAAAAGTAVTLTLLPILRYGRESYVRQLEMWWRISNGGWPTRGNNQSLFAAVDRLVTGFAEPHDMASGSPITAIVVAALALALLATFVVATWGARSRADDVPRELAMITLLAVLLSPIAWEHYWVLLFPAFFVAYAETALRPRLRAVLWTAAVLTSVLTPMTLGRRVFDEVRERSPMTAAALMVFGVTAGTTKRTTQSPRSE
jgi:hypothetical protein